MKLRNYTPKDAEKIVSWINDEKSFRLWCADRFENYPLSAEEFNKIYSNGSADFFGMIAEDEENCIGHFFVQKLENQTYKLGLIIVDNTKRGKGYGRRMVEAAINFVKQETDAKRVVLSAFDNNPSAYNCYKNLGFKETGNYTLHTLFGKEHKYIELENKL